MISISELFRKDNPFDYIVLGFLCKLFGTIAGFFISYQVADAAFGLISWILTIKGITLIPGKLSFPFSGHYRSLLKFYLFLCVIMIIRGYMIDYNYIWFTTVGAINYHLFMPTYLLCYLMPFAAMIPLRYINFRLITSYSFVIILLNIFLIFIFRHEIMKSTILGAMGLNEDIKISADTICFCAMFGFLALFYKYLPSNMWRINILGVAVSLLCMIMGARRGGTVLMSIMLMGSFYFFSSSKKGFLKFLSYVGVAVGVTIAAIYIADSAISSYLMERGMEDTRSLVEETMLDQMSTFEKVFGKGLNGRYYCPLRDDDYLNGWRYGIETGFYNIVLKGGYLMAIIYCLLLFIPAWKGMFKSNNNFCKAAAFFIFYHLISLKPFGILSFNISFLFLWIFIACCMNDNVREMSDDEIKNQFFYNV